MERFGEAFTNQGEYAYLIGFIEPGQLLCCSGFLFGNLGKQKLIIFGLLRGS